MIKNTLHTLLKTVYLGIQKKWLFYAIAANPPLEAFFLGVLRNKMFATAVRSQFTVSQEHVASVRCARDNHKDSVESQRAWSMTAYWQIITTKPALSGL